MSGTAFTRGHHLCFMVLALLLMALIPEPVAAQRGGSDRGRGGSGGGFQGRGGSGGGFQGRGGSGGGFQGRGGSDRGAQGRGGSDRGSQGRGGSDRGSQGRGGSDRGSQGRGGSGGTSEFLKRLDTNGNGNLDPSEQGRMRPLLERISSARRDRGSSSLDLSRPIPISRLTEEFNRMREERNGGSSSRGSSRGGGLSRGDSGSLSQTELEPLVPTFDFEEEQYIPLPTFGPEGERNTVNVTEADRKEAAQTMKRYDKNGDNVLSKEEIAQARWRDDPLQQDRNRDGRLTMNELYLRYALRRTDNKDQSSSSNRGGSSRGSSSRSSSSRDSSSRGSSSGRDSSGRGSSGRGGDSSSSSGTDRMAFFANSMMQRYDKNGSGVLEKDEWKSFRTDPSPGDTNKDGKLTKEELTKWMSSRFGQRGGDRSSGAGSRGRGGDSSGGRGRGGDSSGGRGRGDSGGRDRGGKSDSDKPTSYRFKTLAERLPEGLPEWFKSNDANGDGQIMMAEYSKNWNAQMLDSFDKFDFNADGVITAQECLDAIDEGARFGGSASDSRSRSASQKDDSGSKEGSKESSSKSSSGGSSRAARYANSIMEKMDSDKSGSLSKEEWSKSRWIKDSFDKDGDGKMTVEELTKGFGG